MPKSSFLPFNPAKYALVADRITLFYEQYPTGRILTRLISRDRDVVFRASVYRSADDRVPAATGWASEREGDGDINLVACVENTETSAIGRALANLGFTASRRRPSREEMLKAERARARTLRVAESGGTYTAGIAPESAEIRDLLLLVDLAERAGMPPARAALLRKRIEARASTPAFDAAALSRRLRRWVAARHERVSAAG